MADGRKGNSIYRQKAYMILSEMSDNWPPGAEDASRNDDEMTDPEKRILGFSVFAHVAKKRGVQGCTLTL
jgi:hypothetical protein